MSCRRLPSCSCIAAASRADSGFCEKRAIFPTNPKHNHASCVVQTKDGSLLAAWYAGSGERKSDDVVIEGAWLPRENRMGPEVPDGGYTGLSGLQSMLFAAPDGTIWLFWPTILDHRWEGALLKFARCDQAGAPRSAQVVGERGSARDSQGFRERDGARDRVSCRREDRRGSRRIRSSMTIFLGRPSSLYRDELFQRLGWMPRVHPIVLPVGPVDPAALHRHVFGVDHGDFRRSRPNLDDEQAVDRLRQYSAEPGAQRMTARSWRSCATMGSHHKIRLSSSRDDGVLVAGDRFVVSKPRRGH